MKILSWVVSGLMVCGGALELQAQDRYPSKPIQMVVPFSAGGAADIVARLIGAQMSSRLGQPIVVENKSGAGGAIATDYAAKAPADGYTVLMVSNTFTTLPVLNRKFSWNPTRDFRALYGVGSFPNVIVVHPDVPAKSMDELLALAKATPGAVTYASAGIGSTGHFSGELLAYLAKVSLTHIPYKGQPEAINDLLAGRLMMMPINSALVLQYVKSGKLRALAVTSATRSGMLPDVPTVAEATGLAGYEVGAWAGFVVRSDVPDPIARKLGETIGEIVNLPETTSQLVGLGMVMSPQNAQEFGRYISSESDKWAKVISSAHISLE
jgi:tripartite-type tricarboxylate transporter receptor subunit TctC